MKRVILPVSIVCLIFASTVFAYSGGNGTKAEPYQIADVNDFQQLSNTPTDWDKFFILTADVNLTGLTFTQAPIAPDVNSSSSGFQGTWFTGVFNGNGHIISNLTIIAPAQDCIGLFGWVYSTSQICNLGVENVNITGRCNVGGVVGFKYGGSLLNCHVSGSITGTGDYNSNVGGLVGYNSGALISSCCGNKNI